MIAKRVQGVVLVVKDNDDCGGRGRGERNTRTDDNHEDHQTKTILNSMLFVHQTPANDGA